MIWPIIALFLKVDVLQFDSIRCALVILSSPLLALVGDAILSYVCEKWRNP